MIDYEGAESEARLLLRLLQAGELGQTRRQRCVLRLAWLVAALELLVILAGAAYAL